MRLAEFGLIHRDGRGLDTSANTSNESCDQNLGDRVGCRLQNSSDDDPDHSKPHAFAPAEFLAEEEVYDRPCESSKIVDTDDDALESRVRVTKGVQPVCICDNAREDTLIVPKQDEGELACEGDGILELSPTSEDINVHHDRLC